MKTATELAQKIADQELEACCEWLDSQAWAVEYGLPNLRAARRPKPPSLKEQALGALSYVDEKLDLPLHNHCNAITPSAAPSNNSPTPTNRHD